MSVPEISSGTTVSPTSGDAPALPKWLEFKPKELAKMMGTYYTVPLFDKEEKDKDGKSIRKFYMKSLNGSQLTAEYILILLRHINDIVVLPGDIQELIREENDIRVWGDLYALNSTDLNSRLSESISGNRGNVPGGNAGNIAVAYFTPYLSQICKSALQSRGIDIGEKAKLLSQDQMDKLNEIEAYLVMDKDNINIGIPLKHLSKESLDFAISHWKHLGYAPVRIIFENLLPGHANAFNTKPVNDRVKVVMRNEIKKFFEIKGSRAEFLSSAHIRENYGINVQDAVKRQLSNNGFWCTFDHNEALKEIYILKYKELYFAKVNDFGQFKVQFSENSFVDRSVKRKDDVLFLTGKNKDGVERVTEVIDLDVYNVFERTNYNGFLSKNAGRGKNHKINLYDYIIDSCGDKIEELLSSTKELSTYHGDNNDDEAVQRTLQSLSKEPNAIFSLVKTKNESTGVDDLMIQIKNSAKINATVSFYDRSFTDSPRRTNDNNSVINFTNLHKSNLAFEREKVMTVLFVQTALDWLKTNGHSDIYVELERPTRKTNNESGYLDCTLYSKKGGIQYGQIYEFKSWYDFELNAQTVLKLQCIGYDVKNVINKRGVTINYSDENIHSVKGMNLTRSGAFPIKGEAEVPWLPKMKWPYDFTDKSVDKKELTSTAGILQRAIDEASEIFDTAIPDLVEEAKQLASKIAVMNKDKPTDVAIVDNQALGFQ